MARIRTIKPEFWTSEQVVECSPTARLLFVGLWNFCDDGGVHSASVKRPKMEVFPVDDFSAQQIADLITELRRAGLVVQYVAQGKWWWAVTGWHHQRIEKPSYRYPRQEIDDRSPTVLRPVDDYSTTILLRTGDGDGNGDGNGKGTGDVRETETEMETESISGRDETGRDDQRETAEDWDAVRAEANRRVEKLGLKATRQQDRSLLLKASALVLSGRLPENWLADSIEATRAKLRSDKPPAKPWAFLHKCLANKAADLGVELKPMLARVNVPAELLKGTP